MNKDFIAGFICGEGCFTFRIYQTTKASAVFSICLSDRDSELLELIVKELEIKKSKNIMSIMKEKDSEVCYTKGNVLYQLVGLENNIKIVEYFEGHLYGQKLRQFERYKQGIEILKSAKGRKLSISELKIIDSLKASNEY